MEIVPIARLTDRTRDRLAFVVDFFFGSSVVFWVGHCLLSYSFLFGGPSLRVVTEKMLNGPFLALVFFSFSFSFLSLYLPHDLLPRPPPSSLVIFNNFLFLCISC